MQKNRRSLRFSTYPIKESISLCTENATWTLCLQNFYDFWAAQTPTVDLFLTCNQRLGFRFASARMQARCRGSERESTRAVAAAPLPDDFVLIAACLDAAVRKTSIYEAG